MACLVPIKAFLFHFYRNSFPTVSLIFKHNVYYCFWEYLSCIGGIYIDSRPCSRHSQSISEVAQSCPTLRDPMDCSLPGSSAHGIFHARVLEWGAIAFSITYTMEHYSALKRKGILTRASLYTNLEDFMVGKISQSQKTTHSMIPLTWSIESRQIHRDRK